MSDSELGKKLDFAFWLILVTCIFILGFFDFSLFR